MCLAEEIEWQREQLLTEMRNALRCYEHTERAQAVLDEALSPEDAAEKLYALMEAEPELFASCLRQD